MVNLDAMERKTSLSPKARNAAGAIAVVVIATMVAQTWVDLIEGKSLLGAIWHQVRYFTNLCVLFTGLMFGASFLRNRWVGGDWTTAAMVLMVMVAVVYYALLAKDHHPEGLDVLVNISQHTGIPLLVLAVWAIWIPKDGLCYLDPLRWMAFPVIYACYAILRGTIDGTYPYFFLNPEKTGWPGVVAYIVGIAVAYYIISAFFILYARWQTRLRTV